MANDLSNIRNSILEIVNLPKNFYYGVVKSVNNDVCDLELGNLTITEVPLALNPGDKSEAKIIVKPKVGSNVLFIDLTGRLTDLMIIKFSEIECVKLQYSEDIKVDINPQGVNIDSNQITLNGGNNNGLINIVNLTDKLNNLKSEIDNFISDYKAHTHTSAAPNSPTSQPIVPYIGTISRFKKEDYEDTQVKH